MYLKVLCESLQLYKIDAKYINDSLIEMDGTKVHLSGNMISFGKCRSRFSDVYDILSVLNQEEVIFCNTDMKFKIKSTYSELLHTLKSKVTES